MTRGRLVRSLTLVPATAIILANIIGTGVFVKARVMTCNVGTPGMVLVVWLLAGLLSLTGAMVYAELSTMMPRAGGEYNFIGAAYGRICAFIYGWTRILAGGAGTAAVAIMLVIFLNDLTGERLSPTLLRTLPLAAIALSMAMNLLSARANGGVATALTVGKVLLVLGVGVGAFVFGDGSWLNFADSAASGTFDDVPDSARGGMTGFGAAMLGALWGYNGWNSITALGGEVDRPGRTLPRALVGGTLLVVLLYLLINAAYFYVLTPLEVAGVPATSSVAREVAGRFLGAGAAAVLSAGLMLSAFGTLHATMLAAPRLPYALARSGMLPRALTRVTTRGTPGVAVLAVGTWAILLAASGTFDILTDMYIFLLWIFYGMNGLSLVILRRARPDAERPYRVWGYPIVPALFILVTAWLLLNTLVATPGRALSGLVLVLSGLPAYAWFARRADTIDRASWLGSDED